MPSQANRYQQCYKKIPLSFKDLFNPQSNTKLTRGIATAAFTLVIILGIASYNYIQTQHYGTVTQLNNSTIYEHHDLLVGFDKTGKISLLGHSAFSDGYYSASFNNIPTLMAFITSSKDDFSTEQTEWLTWVLKKESPQGSIKASVATNAN